MKDTDEHEGDTVWRWSGAPPEYIIGTQIQTKGYFHTCYHAQTLEAYSKKLRCTVWIALPCKQWKCPHCATEKIDKLSRRTDLAKPNRLLTLTVDPARWKNPRDAFDGTRRQVPELIRSLRLKFGEVEYLRVTELTKGGWPHYHLLVRSGFLPQPIVKKQWCDLTGAIIVDLRRVKNKHQTYIYLVKYLTKMHTIGWTERHVSYSRKFFLDAKREKTNPLELEDHVIRESHPGTLMYHSFRKSRLVEITFGVFIVNPSEETVADYTNEPFANFEPLQVTTCPREAQRPKRSPAPNQKPLEF